MDNLQPAKQTELHMSGLCGSQSAKATGQAERKDGGMTNYERIKSMPIEELARAIDVYGLEANYCKPDCKWGEEYDYNVLDGECRKCIVKWLQEESK